MNNLSIMEQLDLMSQKRNEIMEYDIQILSLLEQRIEAAKVIGDIKRMNGKPIYVPEVEREKIEKLSAASGYPGLVEAVWPVIMCYTRSVE